MNIHWPEGIDTEVFLQDYWQQQPLLIKGAFPDFDNPLDENELAGLATDEDANARFIECVDGYEWRLSHGPFDDAFFSELSGNQWSLLISDIEKLLPEFRQYLAPFRFIPDWRIDDLMISYAPVGGSVGAHVDQYDVFLLQSSGARQWQYENSPRKHTQEKPDAAIALLGDFIADHTFTLNAGDMLYLPPQYAHHGIAVEEPCMTWSIGFRAPSTDEMLPSLITYLLEESTPPKRFTDIQRALTSNPGCITEDDLSGLRQLIRESLNASDRTLDRCIGRYLSEPAMEEQAPPMELELSDLLTTDTVYLCNSEHTLIFKETGDRALFFANGECFDTSLVFAETLCTEREINTADIAKSDCNAFIALVNQHTLFEDDEQ